MKKILRPSVGMLAVSLLAALGPAASPASWAMEFNLVDSTLVMSGPVVGDDLARLKDQLATAVSGKCESACGLIFLGGKERSFSDGKSLNVTMVGLHGAHHTETKQAMPVMSARIAHFIRNMTDARFPGDLLDRTVYPKDPSDFMYTFHPLRFRDKSVPRGVMECKKQPDGKFKCTMVDGLDGFAIGVITKPEITVLDNDVKELLGRL